MQESIDLQEMIWHNALQPGESSEPLQRQEGQRSETLLCIRHSSDRKDGLARGIYNRGGGDTEKAGVSAKVTCSRQEWCDLCFFLKRLLSRSNGIVHQ